MRHSCCFTMCFFLYLLVKVIRLDQVSISSTFLCTNFFVRTSYVLPLAKNSYKKRARKTLMKLTAVP